jgi:transglutaminase-like putative cysteine protease
MSNEIAHPKLKQYDWSIMKFLRYLVLVIPSCAVFVLFFPRAAEAANFTYQTAVTYRVEDNGSTAVTQNYTVTNRTPLYYLTELKITTPTESVNGLRVNYSDGFAIPAALSRLDQRRGDVSYPAQEIHIRFPRQIYGQNRTWNFTITYQAGGLVETKGSSHTVYVPAVELSDPGDDYRVTLDVPSGFGRPHFLGSHGTAATRPGRQLYHFEKSEVTGASLALAFGDSTVYRLGMRYPLHNGTPVPRRLTITLPPDLGNQRSYLNRLDPAPSSIRLDTDGNVLAEYWLKPRQKLEVNADVSGEARYLEYDLSKSGKRGDIPQDIVARYTAPTAYWPTDGDVAKAAHALNDDNAPVINNVKGVYQFVINKLSYNNEKIKFNIRQGAAKALAAPENAVCLEYSDLTIAMLRSIGIPARMPVGYAYSGSLKESKGVSDALHSWVEAYVPGIGWITLDPTWGEKFDQFGKADLDHFAFAVWGEKDQLPDAVMAGRSSLGYQYEHTTLSYQAKVEPPTSNASLSVQRWAILPMIGLDRLVVTATAGIASDGNLVNVNGQKLELGSLAPGQKYSLWRPRFGRHWNQPAESIFSRQSDNQVIVMAESRTRANYTPMIVISVLLVAVILGAVVRWRLHNRNKAPETGS